MLQRARVWLSRLVLVLGLATFLYLLWSFGPGRVWGLLAGFGWGFAVVLPFQLFDHMLNAMGWRLCFAPEDAARVPFSELVRVRVAGDGVNYLTPSGNLAGEFVRPAMLRTDLPLDSRATSVIVAKAAQAAGQALFVLLGLAYLLHGRLYSFSGRQAAYAAGAMAFIVVGVCVALWLLASEPPAWVRARFPGAVSRSAEVRERLRRVLRRHPARLAGSVAFFVIGYAWGAAEIWIISRFLGLSLSPATCLAVEFMSNLVDALAFMVPAKLGTQEAGKAAIFAGLGMPAHLGFTLGMIRHVRELAWAGLGLSLYARHARRQTVLTA